MTSPTFHVTFWLVFSAATVACFGGLKSGNWLAGDKLPIKGHGQASKPKARPGPANLWGCGANETLVLYTVWTPPKMTRMSSYSKALKLPLLRPLARVRCCPSPGPEEHIIPGEVCPLGRAEDSEAGGFVLPRGLFWAPAEAPCLSAPIPLPPCCTQDALSYCQIVHDRTRQGTICPIGRPVCCRHQQGQPGRFEVTAKGLCHGALENAAEPSFLSNTNEELLETTRKRFPKDWLLSHWLNDKSPKPLTSQFFLLPADKPGLTRPY